MTVLTSLQTEFVESVLTLKPRVTTFDCDGTLWSGDAGEGFFSWELNQGLVSDEIVQWARQRYADYKAGKVAEDAMCGEMVTMHRGMQEEVVQQACDSFFARAIAPNIFPEMRELVQRLHASGCDVWAVSSSNQWIMFSVDEFTQLRAFARARRACPSPDGWRGRRPAAGHRFSEPALPC